MKASFQFNHEHYHNALKSCHYVPSTYRQRGGGLGGFVGRVSHYSIPIFKKYVIPEVKSTAVKTVKDVFNGTPIRSAIIRNIKELPKNVGKNILHQLIQEGGSISRKRRAVTVPTPSSPKKRKTQKAKPNTSKPRKVKKSKSVKPSLKLTKRDIFGSWH